MISSSSSSLPSTSRKKPKPAGSKKNPAQTRWRTGAQERIYSRRLVEAIQSTRAAATPAEQPAAGARAIKEAADSALAVTAQGRTRWSRAILSARRRRCKLLLKAGGKLRRPPRRPRPQKPAPGQEPPAPPRGRRVQDRLRALGRLVPGCRKLSAPSLLEEAADYVAALELQVKAMRALAEAMSAAALSAPAAAPAPGEPED